MSSSSENGQCAHVVSYLEPSPFAELAGFERQDARKRVGATLKSGRAAPRSQAIEKEAIELSATFPAPLVLPHDDLNYDPDHPPQSFKSWVNEKARNQITAQRGTLYVARVPAITTAVGWMTDCTRPNLDGARGKSEKPVTIKTEVPVQEPLESPDADYFIEYLRAFYYGMHVKGFPKQLRWVQWKDIPKLSSTRPSTIPKYVALAHGNRSTRIRVRPSPDGLFAAQLNLDDILDAAIDMLPEDAYSLLLLVDHDIYENEDDDFCCGRAYGGSRVCVVQTARYRPSLDPLEKIDLSHMWPMSHCKNFVDTLCAVEDVVPQRPTVSQIRLSKSGSIRAAITAGVSPTLPSTPEDFKAQWFARLARTVSHELGHCMGMGHCIYYACNLQGTAGMKEDVRQPPYLCLVCEAKLSYAVAVELQRGTESDRERYVWERCNALREFCDKVVQEDKGPGPTMWRALSAWLTDRMSMHQ